QLPHAIVFRPESSLLYVNADHVMQSVLERLRDIGQANIRMIVCDLSASPYIDLAGARMLRLLNTEVAPRGIDLRVVVAREGVRAGGILSGSTVSSKWLGAGWRPPKRWSTASFRQNRPRPDKRVNSQATVTAARYR